MDEASVSVFVCFVWAEATSKGGKSCQSKPGSHIKSVLVNPFQSRSSKGKKQKTTKGMTASEAPPSFTPEKHCQKMPCAHKHTNPPTQTQTAQVQIKKTASGFQASLPRVCLPRRPASSRTVDMFDLGEPPPRPTKQDSPPLSHNSTVLFLLAW